MLRSQRMPSFSPVLYRISLDELNSTTRGTSSDQPCYKGGLYSINNCISELGGRQETAFSHKKLFFVIEKNVIFENVLSCSA